jgi:hypothetical protein
MTDYRLLYECERVKTTMLSAGLSPAEIELVAASAERLVASAAQVAISTPYSLAEAIDAMHVAIAVAGR